MDLNDYFDPVGLERPAFTLLSEEDTFSRNIVVHTPDHPIRDLDRFHLALIGIPQDDNAFIKGSRTAPDMVRTYLYQLRKPQNNIRICDLGNLKITASVNDSYYALRDIYMELRERNIIPVLIGGSQDLSLGILYALEKDPGIHQVLTVDPRLDFSAVPGESQALHSMNYLDYIMKQGREKVFVLNNIGHQNYFVPVSAIEYMETHFQESVRLGMARSDIRITEPLIRDASFVSIDMSVIRHSDAPGVALPSPNGFFGDEICSISRYCGLSEKVSAIGFFELCPGKDLNEQSAHLAAQALWYFTEGFSHRIKENPVDTPGQTRKFIVNLDAAGHDIIFIKSTISERWWMEIPVKNPATGGNFFISCSYEDYQQACNQEIPDRWWRYLHRLSPDPE
ncbi:MAG: formimidoylglutamase [Bacteroidota bacterium]